MPKPRTDLIQESVVVEGILVHSDATDVSSNLGEKPAQKRCRIEVSLVAYHIIDGDYREKEITSQEKRISSQRWLVFEDGIVERAHCIRAVDIWTMSLI